MSRAQRYSYPIDLNSDSTAAKVVRLVGNGKSVLELGCAEGHMSRIFQENGCKVIAVEIDREAAQSATPHCERVIIGDLERLDLAAELQTRRFDVVVAADVLEHLKDPASLLLRLKEFLAPEGYIVASIPNVAHASVRLGLLAGDFRYRDRGLLDRSHLRFFTRETVQDLFEEAGFVISTFDRNRVEMERSEVSFPHPVAEEVLDSLAEDPEATTYQFIVTAHPLSPGAVQGLRGVLREFEEEARAARQTAAQARKTARKLSGQRRKSRLLEKEKRALIDKAEALERAVLDKSQIAEEFARLSAMGEASSRAAADLREAVDRQSDVLERIASRIEAVSESQTELSRHFGELGDWLWSGLEELKANIERGRAAGGSRFEQDSGERESAAKEPEDEAVRVRDYRLMVERIQAVVRRILPLNSRFLVVSRGDDELLRIEGRAGEHFPQREDGVYAGYYPADGRDAISHLEEICAKKEVHYLLFPAVAFWWLEHYPELKIHLESSCRKLFFELDTCLIFELKRTRKEAPLLLDAESSEPGREHAPVQRLVDALLPAQSPLVIMTVENALASGWGRRRVYSFDPTEDGDALKRLERLRDAGAMFLVVPQEAFRWLQGQAELKERLESQYPCLVRRSRICAIYSLGGEA